MSVHIIKSILNYPYKYREDTQLRTICIWLWNTEIALKLNVPGPHTHPQHPDAFLIQP